jgi:hypothetical protein
MSRREGCSSGVVWLVRPKSSVFYVCSGFTVFLRLSGRVGSGRVISALTAADRGLSQPPPDKHRNSTSKYVNIFVSLFIQHHAVRLAVPSIDTVVK